MAKYSKAAAQSVKTAMRKMEKGKLTSGRSGKKVASRKQAIAIGLSEAREKGAKVPAKKTASRKTAAKKTAPKRATAKKSAAAKKSGNTPAKKAAPKKAATKRTMPKKGVSKKSPPKKAAAKKSVTARKKQSPVKAKKPLVKRSKKVSSKAAPENTEQSYIQPAIVNEAANTSHTQQIDEIITNTDTNTIPLPEDENEKAVFSGTQPEQQWVPEELKATPNDPYHGHTTPSKAKTNIKPSGKKPLWDSRK